MAQSKMLREPFLEENPDRFVMFPIKYPDIWKMYKDACASFWTAEEIDFAGDLIDYPKLSENEQYFIKMILAFFSSSDGIVNENLCYRFYNEIQIPEARAFYGFQVAIESIHSEVYSLMIDTFVKDTVEKDKLFHAIDNFPSIKKKADWAIKYIQSEDDFATRLIAFAIVEGVFFSGAFCSIFWIKQKGLMPGLCFSNELIARDESSHTLFAVLIYSHLNNKLSQEKIYNIMKEAVEIETEFINSSIPCSLLGMNSDLMTQYIQFVSDRLLVQLGCDQLYKVKNPFPFMESIGLQNNTNFFESRVSEYNKASIIGGNKEFVIDEDF
jgi:ribonucleotide reductase beta subunit family protein with ferritin-like domain